MCPCVTELFAEHCTEARSNAPRPPRLASDFTWRNTGSHKHLLSIPTTLKDLQTATLWILNLPFFIPLLLFYSTPPPSAKELLTKHYCLHCAISRHHLSLPGLCLTIPRRWDESGSSCSLEGLQYPGNRGSLRDLTVKLRY